MAKSTTASSAPSVSLWERTWFPYAILTVLWAIVYAMVFDTKLNLGGDNAVYYILGDAISSGEGYTNVHRIGMEPNNHFPPGYPSILAFFMLFSKSINFLKFVSGLFFLGTILTSYRIFSLLIENKRLAFAISAILLMNGTLLEYSSIMMSEVPYLFFSSVTVLLFMLSERNDKFLTDWRFWVMLLLASFSYHIRTAGIALIGGLAIYLLFNKKWLKFGVFSIGFGLLGLPWFLRGKSLGGTSYLNQLLQVNPYRPEDGMVSLGDMFTRLSYNLQRYFQIEIPRAFFPNMTVQYQGYMRYLTGEETPQGYEPESMIVIGIILFALMVFGIYNMKKYRSFVAFYMLGSAAILLLWPYVWFGTRFIMIILPFMIFTSVLGVQAILDKVGLDKSINPLAYLLLGVFFIKGLQAEAAKNDEGVRYPDKYADFISISEWAGKNLPEDAVVLNRKPGLFYIQGHRKTTKFPATFDYEEMRAHMNEDGVTHVIIDAMGFADEGRYLVPFIQANMENFTQIQHLQRGQLNTYLLEYHPNRGYTGEWGGASDNGKVQYKEGKGLYRYNDGSIFDGYWKRNQRDGEGQLTKNDGSIIHGTWAADTLAQVQYSISPTGDTTFTSAN